VSAVTSEIATFVSAVTIIGLVVVRLLVLLPPFFMPFRRQGLLVLLLDSHQVLLQFQLLLDDIVTGKRVKKYYDQ
jgi:hypothetical protein